MAEGHACREVVTAALTRPPCCVWGLPEGGRLVTPPGLSPRSIQERVSSIHPEDLMQIVSHMDSRDKHRVRGCGVLQGGRGRVRGPRPDA